MRAFDDDPGVHPTVRQLLAYAAVWDRSPMTAFRRLPRVVTPMARVRSDCRRGFGDVIP
jgi:hypothetical protein